MRMCGRLENICVHFVGDKNNRFNLLTREGRREWRAKRGSLVEEGEGADGKVMGEGC